MLIIDGSYQEGGGQILRTALALSLVTRIPFRIEKIRAKRKRPGLLRQHLTAVTAAANIGMAQVVGDEIGSQEVTFSPREIIPGQYTFSVGTAGSTTLVLQTILPALLSASKPSQIILEGGTHNPSAPPYEFLARAFLPLLNRMGGKVHVALERLGFYPAGGGRLSVHIEPAKDWARLELLNRGEARGRKAKAIVANLPRGIGDREVKRIQEKMSWESSCLSTHVVDSCGPGNVVFLEIEGEHVTEVFTGFGERGVMAEAVAERAIRQARKYLVAKVAVGEYLADQLLIPMALGKGGNFSTFPVSLHTQTNINTIQKFLDCKISVVEDGDRTNLVNVQV